MKAKKPEWVLIAMAMALVIISMLAACGPEEEVLVMQTNGESKVQPVKLAGANI